MRLKCDDCGRTFVYRAHFAVEIYSELYEDWYTQEKKRSEQRIERLYIDMITSDYREMYKNVIAFQEEQLQKLKEETAKILGEEV